MPTDYKRVLPTKDRTRKSKCIILIELLPQQLNRHGKNNGFLEYTGLPKHKAPKERIRDYKEIYLPFSEENQHRKTARCMDYYYYCIVYCLRRGSVPTDIIPRPQ